MKKFFKSLAVLLALTLVLGVVPAAAATAPTLKASSKIIYVGGSEYGDVKSYVNVASYIANLNGGVVTLDSEDDGVLFHIGTTKTTKSKVYAQDIFELGKGDVDVYVDGAKIGTITINVKKNAPKDFQVVVEPAKDEYKVGETVKVSLPIYADAECTKKVDTDLRKVVAGEGIDVVDNGDRTFDLTFKAEGKLEAKAVAYQSEAALADGVSKEKALPFNVVVDQAIVGAKQLTPDSFIVTFVKDVNYTTEDFGTADVYYYTANGVKIPVGSSLKKASTEKNVVTFTMWQNLTAERKYFVNFNGFEVPVELNVGKYEIASFDVADNMAVVAGDDPAVIKYVAKNADGVDITKIVECDFVVDKVLEGEDDVDVNSDTVYFAEAGKAAVVSFALYTGEVVEDEEGNYTDVVLHDEATFASVEKAPAAAAAVAYSYNLAGETPIKDNAAKFSRELTIYMDESVDLESLTALKVTGTGDDAVYAANDDLVDGSDEPYTVAEAEKATITASGEIVGLKEGKTILIVWGYDKDANRTPIDAIDLVIKGAKKVDSLTASLDKKYFNTFDAVGDTITASVVLKDNYGVPVADAASYIKWVQTDDSIVNAGSAVVGDPAYADGVYTFKITGIEGAVAKKTLKGQFVYIDGDVELKSNYVTFINDSKDPETASATLKISKTALDTKLLIPADGVAVDSATVSIELTKDGYTCGNASIEGLMEVKPTTSTTAAAVGEDGALDADYDKIWVTIALDGKVQTEDQLEALGSGLVTRSDDGITITFKNIVTGKQLKAGTYTITAYTVKAGKTGTLISAKAIGTKTLVVKESKADITFTKISDEFGNGVTVNNKEIDSIEDCFVVKYDGIDLADSDKVDVSNIRADYEITNDGRYYIKSITYEDVVFVGFGEKDITVDIGVVIDGNGSNN